ncbi:unnamed protein product, partial [Ectocarpus sp. 4 AP-2014]
VFEPSPLPSAPRNCCHLGDTMTIARISWSSVGGGLSPMGLGNTQRAFHTCTACFRRTPSGSTSRCLAAASAAAGDDEPSEGDRRSSPRTPAAPSSFSTGPAADAAAYRGRGHGLSNPSRRESSTAPESVMSPLCSASNLSS